MVQGAKTRPIDDMSISRVNDASSCSETIDPSEVDHIAAVVRLHADALLIDESVRHSSSQLFGISRCRDRTSRGLQTRLWDKASAYKQLAVALAHASVAISVVWDPASSCPQLYHHVALPFGAAAAVMAFNWVGSGLTHVLASLFQLGVTSFCDVFAVAEEDAILTETEDRCERVLEALGLGDEGVAILLRAVGAAWCEVRPPQGC